MISKSGARILTLLLAGALALGGSGMAGAQQPSPTPSPSPAAQQQGPSQDRQAQSQQPAQQADQAKQQAQQQLNQASQRAQSMVGQVPGLTPVNVSDEQTRQIHEVVRQTVKNALSKGDFDSIADYLIGRDRDRIADAEVNTDQLDNTIEQFNNHWKNKYNNEFDLGNQDQAFQGLKPQVAQVTDPQQLANKWPLTQQGQQGQQRQQPVAAHEIEGKQVAVISFPSAQPTAQSGQGAVASLIQNQEGDWKFDIPNSIDGQTLAANLQKAIMTAISASPSWPQDPNQAYPVVAGQIIQAFYDTASGQQSQQSGQQSQSSGRQSSSSGQASPTPSPSPTPQSQQPGQQGGSSGQRL